MRLAALLAALALAACANAPTPVDPAALGPMSGRELALMTTAQTAAAQGNFDQAQKDYASAAAESHGHVEAHLALADLYLKTHRPAQARDVLERAAQFQPKNPEVNYRLGKIALQENRPQDALGLFERGLASQPNNLDLLVGKGIAHDMLRQHVAAQSAYWQAIGTNPKADLSPVRTNFAMSYLFDNKPEKAVELLKAEVKKPGASPVTRHNLALAYGMLGRHAEARKLLGHAMTEAQRQASLKRLAQYIAQRDASGKAVSAPITPALIKAK